MTGLWVAPVKGLAGIARTQVYLDTAGVAEDRRLFLLRADGSVVTLRRYPQLARVVPALDLPAKTLTLSLPDGTSVRTGLSDVTEAVSATLFGKPRTGHVLPGRVADALSDFVGEPIRVVLATGSGMGWDEGPVSLISQSSIRAVDTPSDADRNATRYRMLVEVDGCEAYQEDTWVGARAQVGAAEVEVSHRLERCVVVNHNPVTGTQDWSGLKTIAARRGVRQLTLGVIATVVRPGWVRLGDPVVSLSGP